MRASPSEGTGDSLWQATNVSKSDKKSSFCTDVMVLSGFLAAKVVCFDVGCISYPVEKFAETFHKKRLIMRDLSENEDGRSWKSVAATTYGIKGIPSCILLDKNGYIIDFDMRGNVLDLRLKEIFGENK